jgi:hypothetical protein
MFEVLRFWISARKPVPVHQAHLPTLLDRLSQPLK